MTLDSFINYLQSTKQQYGSGDFDVVINGVKCTYYVARESLKQLDSIKDFNVLDYKETIEKTTRNFLISVSRGFKDLKHRKEQNRKTNLCLYNTIIRYFDINLMYIKDYNIGINFNDELLQSIFEVIRSNEHLLKDAIFNAPIKRDLRPVYYAKASTEDKIYNIINSYTK